MNTFRQMLEDLGVSVTRETEKELETLCPFHDDRHPSFYVNKESGAWICHSGCGAGSFFELYERLHTLDLQPVGPPRSDAAPSVTVDVALAELVDRGFTPAMLRRWEIEWNADVGAIEIPCYTVDSHLVGYIFRMPEGAMPKYRHPEGFQKSRVLFGLQKLVPFNGRKEVVLVEGPLDAIWLQEAGVPAVAILGSRLAAEQVNVLYELGVHTVTLAFDNDAAGQMATALATEVLRKSAVWVWTIPLPSHYKDVQEIPLEAVPDIVARRHLCTSGRGLIPATLRRWLGHEIGYHDANTAWRY